MAERNAATPHWLVLVLALWVLSRLFPPTGRRRKPRAPHRKAVTCATVNDRVCAVATPNPVFNASRVRPYWTARERARRWRRHRILVMAAHFRLDLDTRDIHTVQAGSGNR